MRYSSLVLLVVALVLPAGCYLAAIPRYEEIPGPVSSDDLAGEWILSQDSLRTMAIDGYKAKTGVKHTIVLNADGSCQYQTALADGKYLERDGRWIVRHSSSERFKNSLDFYFKDMVISRMKVAVDKNRMVLWESWGDPDAGVDLVYFKK